MYSFGARSLAMLGTCHPDLQRVANAAIREFDFAVICGHRGEAEQEVAFARGTSNAHYGESPHNFDPSRAFDAVPWPLDWEDVTRFNDLAVVLKRAANRERVSVAWGGDFKTFKDRPHFELTGWRNMAGAPA